MILRAVAASILAASFTLVLLAQTMKFEGDVLGEDGKPYPNAVITLTRKDIKIAPLQTKTDRRGHFLFIGLAINGVFDIVCEVDGNAIERMVDVRLAYYLNLLAGRPFIIDLRKTKAERDAVAKAAEASKSSPAEAMRGLTGQQKAEVQERVKAQEAADQKSKETSDTFNAGIAALDGKRFGEALAALEKAGQLSPNQPAIYAALGEAHVGLAGAKSGAGRDAEFEKGLEAYTKALELKPDEAGIRHAYGQALAAAGKYAEAIAEMTKAAQINPAGAGKFYFNLGALLSNIGRLEEATDAFKRAIDADPKYAEAYYQYGIGLVGKAQVGADGKVIPAPGTLEALLKYIELAPNGPNAQAAKDVLASMNSSVGTSYTKPASSPGASPGTTSPRKK